MRTFVRNSNFQKPWTGNCNLSTPEIDPKEIVSAFAKGLDVIKAFGADHAEMTLSEVANTTGLTRATARRSLLTLQSLGYVAVEGRGFRLTPRILELGYSYLSGLSFIERIDPLLADIARTTGESCSLSVLDELDVVYVARRTNNHIMSVTLNVGTRLPASHTSMGRVLLSSLMPDELQQRISQMRFKAYTRQSLQSPDQLSQAIESTRQNGFSLVDQELEEGLRSLAVPLYNSRGEVVAALNVGCSALKVSTGKMLNEYLPVLLDAQRKGKELLA